MMKPEESYYQILKRLHGFRQRFKWITMFQRAFLAFGVVIGLGIIFVLTEMIFWMRSTLRNIVDILFLLVFGVMFVWGVIGPLFSLIFLKQKPSDDKLALQVGGKVVNLKDRLVNVIQIFRNRIRDRQSSSQELIELSVHNIAQEIRTINFPSLVSQKKFFKNLRFLFFVIVCGLFLSLIYSKGLYNAFERLMHPYMDYQRAQHFNLSCTPGDTEVVQGEDVQIEVISHQEVPSEMILILFNDQEIFKKVTLNFPFCYMIKNIQKGISYRVETDYDRTPVYRIRVIQCPIVRTLQLTIKPPLYTKMGILAQQANIGEVEAVKGSRIEIMIKSNHNLKEAKLVFEHTDEIPLKIAEKRGIGYFKVSKEDRYYVDLTDTMGLKNSDPITYPVRIINDLHPIARILTPGRNIDLDRTMKVNFLFEAEDDFGISEASLVYWIRDPSRTDSVSSERKIIRFPLENKERTKVSLEWIWNLELLDLYPEEVIYYFFESKDNDNVSGPKKGLSRTYSIRFPSIDEIVQEIDKQQTEQISDLEDIFHESQEIQKRLDKLSEEIKGGRKIGWEEKKQLESSFKTQDQIQKRVKALNQDLDNLLDRLERYDLISMETVNKYQELQELYEEISSPELEEIMRKFNETLQGLDKNQTKDMIDNFKLSQEIFLRSLDRTISLLKRLRIEQKVDELVKRLENMIDNQESVNQTIKSTDQKLTSNVSKTQQDIMKQAELANQEMKNLLEEMRNMTNMPVDELEDALDTIDQQDLLNKVEETLNMIKQQNKSGAFSQGCEAKKGMELTLEQLKKLQESLKMGHKQNVENALMRTSYRLLQLSSEQESLMEGIESGLIPEKQATQKQLSLISGLGQIADSLYQLSKQTFFITPEIGKSIGQAHAEMMLALQRMGERGRGGSSNHQANAMGSLNQTVMAIQEAAKKLGGAGSGLGMEQFFLSLEKMGQQQMSLNRQIQDFLNKGELSLEEQAMISRIAAGQRTLQNQLKELLQQYGNRNDVIGRLDSLIEEMEMSVQELMNKQINPKMIKRQRRILSRLLEAQRSLYRQDTDRKREARSGLNVVRRGPDSKRLPKNTITDQIRRDLLRVGKEGYSKDYQELIKRYFRVLLEKEKIQTIEQL